MPFEKLKEKWQHEREERTALSISRKEALLQKGIPVFKQFGIQKVVLFGSTRMKSSQKSSDIDILVMPLDNEKFWAFQLQLEEALEIQIDLYTDKDDPGFVQKILARGETVYEI